MQVGADLGYGAAGPAARGLVTELTGAFEMLAASVRAASGAFDRLAAGSGPTSGGSAFVDLSAEALDLERRRLQSIQDSNRAYQDGDRAVSELAREHEVAADKVGRTWTSFGNDLLAVFKDLFAEVHATGTIEFDTLFKTVSGKLADLVEKVSGIDLSGLLGKLGGAVSDVAGGTGIGLRDLFGIGGALLDILSPGKPDPKGAGEPSLISAVGGLFGATAGGSGGLGSVFGSLGSLASIFSGSNPAGAIASLALDLLGPTLFARTPSVGPTTISRLLFPAGRGSQIGSADNGGDPAALDGLSDTIFDRVDATRRRYGAGYRNFGLDIGYFPSPNDGSGRRAGYSLSTILDGALGENENIQGLSEPEAIEKAVFLALKNGFQDFDVAEVGEAVQNSAAETLEDLLAELDFAEAFGRLRADLADTGSAIDAMTLSLARQREELAQAGRDQGSQALTGILDMIDRIATLFDPAAAVRPVAADPVPVLDPATLDGFEVDRGGARGVPDGVTLIPAIGENGVIERPAGFRIGDREFSTRINPALGRSGGLELLDQEGAVVGAVRDLVDAVRLAGETLSQEAAGGAAETVVDPERYQANIERLVDGIAIAGADVEAFIGGITGAFEAATIGPFEQRLLKGKAALEEFGDQMPALTERLDDLKTRFPELAGAVDTFIATATASLDAAPEQLRAALAGEFEEGVQADLRRVQGRGAIDDIQTLVDQTASRRADGLAVGADVSGLDDLLGAQVRGVLDAGTLTFDLVDDLRDRFADNATVLAAIDAALADATGAANDNAAAQLTLADVTRLATEQLGEQIAEQEEMRRTAERVVETLADTRRRIALDSDLSILSPAEQLAAARTRFEDVAARARSGDQEAQQELSEAGTDYLDLARDFYASSEDYARIFEQVDGALRDVGSVADRQLAVAEQQLEELREMRLALTGGIGGVPNPAADFGNNPTRNRVIAQLTGYAGDFGNGQFGAFRQTLSAETNRLVDRIAETINFAEGGVMTEAGPLPLRREEPGGVVSAPQLTLFGEGRTPEAFVPLPDGRTIPVTLTPPANADAPPPADETAARRTAGIEALVEETRRLRAEVAAMRLENADLRRGLERTMAGPRATGRSGKGSVGRVA